MRVSFSKYHGTGNDFIIIDDRESQIVLDNHQILWLCHRRFGIGADGLMLLRNHGIFDFEMVYFNSDGYQSSMCGNGGRCLVAFAKKMGVISASAKFMAIDGFHEATIANEIISLRMNDVTEWQKVGEDIVLNTGSPHYVRFQTDDIMAYEGFIDDAKAIRKSANYVNDGINVNFIQLLNTQSLVMRTYERGVEDETYSCGTGAVAAAIASHAHQGLGKGQFQIDIATVGGPLMVKFEFTEDKKYTDVYLIGPAQLAFEGEIEIPNT